jgi:hypothetical protein
MSVGRSQFDSMRAAPIVSRESALASTPRRSRRISLRVSTGNTYESSASRSIGFIVSQPYAMGRRRAVCQRGRAHVRALGQRLEVRAQTKVERHALEAFEAGTTLRHRWAFTSTPCTKTICGARQPAASFMEV